MSATSHVVVIAILWIAYELMRPLVVHLLKEPRAVLEIYRIRRQQRAQIAAEIKRVAGLKARIERIGSIEGVDASGALVIGPGWSFDCSNGVPINRIDERGIYRFCGYTKKELLEIHARRDEYVDRRHR